MINKIFLIVNPVEENKSLYNYFTEYLDENYNDKKHAVVLLKNGKKYREYLPKFINYINNLCMKDNFLYIEKQNEYWEIAADIIRGQIDYKKVDRNVEIIILGSDYTDDILELAINIRFFCPKISIRYKMPETVQDENLDILRKFKIETE